MAGHPALPPSRRLATPRYGALHRVEDDGIADRAVYVEIVDLLARDGRSPLPNAGVLATLTPGSTPYDGLLNDPQPNAEVRTTVEPIVGMVDEPRAGGATCSEDLLERSWTLT